MLEAIVIIIIIACVLLILTVLIQNPKGGGLSQSFGGFSNQMMGVKRTTDFLEKTTWSLIGGIAVLSLVTIFFINRSSTTATSENPLKGLAPTSTPLNQQQQPAANQNAAPLPAGDSTAK